MKLSERIRRWRQSRDGLTKSELARLCGVSSAAVAQWEQDVEPTTPTTGHIEKIAEAIGVSMAVFWGEPPRGEKKRRAS